MLIKYIEVKELGSNKWHVYVEYHNATPFDATFDGYTLDEVLDRIRQGE